MPAEETRLNKYVKSLIAIFKAGTHNKGLHATQYLKGLFQGQKRNIERMVERVVESDYYQIQHFIVNRRGMPGLALTGWHRIPANYLSPMSMLGC